MRERNRLLGLLPWLLCAAALAMLGAAAVLFVLARLPEATGLQVATSVVEALGFVSFPVVGAVVASRLPANSYGWVWCSLGIASSVLTLAAALADAGAVSGWPLLAAANIAYLALIALLVFVFLLFPTGSLPSRRWRWPARSTVVLGVLLAAATPFAPTLISPGTRPPWAPGGAAGRLLADVALAGPFVLLVLVLVAIVSVFSRSRSAVGVERQQLKWFLLAAAAVAVYLSVDLFGVPDRLGEEVWAVVGVVSANLVPVALAVAVLRYRLYEIDRIISRSVSYALLTGGVVALYLALVAVLRPVLEPLTGSSALAVAGSTLAAAAVFSPARRRLQEAVDRRFDRARYDAVRTVDAFAVRLRDQVDLDQITAGLHDTVTATVAPARLAIWLRPAGRRQQAG